MRNFLLAAFLLCLSISATAIDYQKTTSTAMASSQDKAISRALAQAIGQVNGKIVEQNVNIQESNGRVYMGFMGNTVEIPSGEIDTGFTQSASHGVVRRYTVKNTEYISDSKMYKVTVEAEVQVLADFKNIGGDRSTLTPLVIAPLKANRTTYERLDGPAPARRIIEEVTDQLSAAIAQSNQFRVLDRANMSSLLSEDFVTESLGQRTGQQLKMAQKISADIIVVGSIREFSISSRAVESYGSIFTNYEGEIVLDIKAIETATGEVRFAKRFEQYLDHNQIKASLNRYGRNIFNPNQKTNKRRVQNAIEAILINKISVSVIHAFNPEYVAPSEIEQPMESSIDKKTPLSDSPGSSETPWTY